MNAQNPWGIAVGAMAPQQAPSQFQTPTYSVNTGYGSYTFPQGNPGGGTYGTNFGEVGMSYVPGRGVTGYSVPTAFGVNYGYSPGRPASGSYSTPTGFNTNYGYTPGRPGGQFSYAAGGMGVAAGGAPQEKQIAYNPSAWYEPQSEPVTVIAPSPRSGTMDYYPSPSKDIYAPQAEKDVYGRVQPPGGPTKPLYPTGGPYGNGMDYAPSDWSDDYEKYGVQDPYEAPSPRFDPFKDTSVTGYPDPYSPEGLAEQQREIQWNRQQYYPHGGSAEMSGQQIHDFLHWLDSNYGGL